MMNTLACTQESRGVAAQRSSASHYPPPPAPTRPRPSRTFGVIAPAPALARRQRGVLIVPPQHREQQEVSDGVDDGAGDEHAGPRAGGAAQPRNVVEVEVGVGCGLEGVGGQGGGAHGEGPAGLQEGSWDQRRSGRPAPRPPGSVPPPHPPAPTPSTHPYRG